MADPIDRAQDHIERETPYLLAARKRVTHRADGRCHNCGAEIVSFGLYCDQDCREDFEYRLERGIA